ncbi:MAG: rhodanese-like domain-containing protein [Acidobacteriota bacterium]|nr:rhodanese-like domain-containing protein [Acidobacteriota bacterium]
MKFKQFYLGCLAHASYYIGSGAEAAIVDPQRDVAQYLDEAEANNQKIRYVIETHLHADFVSGHLELARKTGAEIIYGERAQTIFPTHKVKDGDELTLGKIKLKFLETPGHTPEGISILVESDDAPLKVLTGDTLFIGDVGRPDLIGSKGFTAEEMAGLLYDSLHDKLMKLPDDTEVYPAHGAGSLCGKNMSKETWSTLGSQKQFNYALQPMTKEEFVKIVADSQPEVPAYFPKSAARNLEGSPALEDLPKPEEFSTAEINDFGGVVLDVRANIEYGAGHIPNAVNIGLGGQFASWAGTLIEIGTPIVIAAETPQQVDEAFMRLARVGIETVRGFILMADYAGEKGLVEQVSVEKVKEILSDDIQFVDVRRAAEHAGGHAPNTINLPADVLAKEIGKLNPDKPTYVICQSGYRSSLGTSILENAGFKEIYKVTGGTQAWIKAGFDTEVAATI